MVSIGDNSEVHPVINVLAVTANSSNNRAPQVSFALDPSNSVVPGDNMSGNNAIGLVRRSYPANDGATDNNHNQQNTASALHTPSTRTSTAVRPGAYSATGRPVGFLTWRYRNRNSSQSHSSQDSQAHLPPEMRVPRRPRPSRSVIQRISTLMFAGDASVQTQQQRNTT